MKRRARERMCATATLAHGVWSLVVAGQPSPQWLTWPSAWKELPLWPLSVIVCACRNCEKAASVGRIGVAAGGRAGGGEVVEAGGLLHLRARGTSMRFSPAQWRRSGVAVEVAGMVCSASTSRVDTVTGNRAMPPSCVVTGDEGHVVAPHTPGDDTGPDRLLAPAHREDLERRGEADAEPPPGLARHALEELARVEVLPAQALDVGAVCLD